MIIKGIVIVNCNNWPTPTPIFTITMVSHKDPHSNYPEKKKHQPKTQRKRNLSLHSCGLDADAYILSLAAPADCTIKQGDDLVDGFAKSRNEVPVTIPEG